MVGLRGSGAWITRRTLVVASNITFDSRKTLFCAPKPSPTKTPFPFFLFPAPPGPIPSSPFHRDPSLPRRKTQISNHAPHPPPPPSPLPTSSQPGTACAPKGDIPEPSAVYVLYERGPRASAVHAARELLGALGGLWGMWSSRKGVGC